MSIANGQHGKQVGWMSKFGAGGGFNVTWMFPNYDDINKQLPALGINEKFEGGLLVLGGGGYTYLMMIDNVRVGGMGYGGSSSVTSNVAGFNREIKYGLGGGAFTIEYTLPFIKRIAVSVGGMIGGGQLTIETYQNKSDFSWQGAWDEFNNSDGSRTISNEIKNSFITLSPTLNIDVPLTRFLAIRVGTGYQFSVNESWTINNDQAISGMPSSLNGDSFFIQTGIYLGFFAY